jgi:CubicO group peptidase (beta-lactamase class C family)
MPRSIGQREVMRRASNRPDTAGSGAGAPGEMKSSVREQDATSATTPSNGDAPGVTPQRVAAALTQLDDLAHQTLERTKIPGMAIAVVYADETPYLKGFGTREEGRDAPVSAGTVFQLASVSKPIASTIVAGVVGDGIVTWDSRITDITPQFHMLTPWVTSQVTLRDMFCHRSGLPEHGGDLLEDLGFDREDVLFRLRFMNPESSFRSTYDYTNFGMTAAAVAAATAAETVWEDLAARRLYQPLGMEQTSSRYADFMSEPDHAVGHMLVDGVWTHKEQRQPDAQSPAGGVSSTVRDLSRWMRLQLGNGTFEGKEIITAAALAATHAPQIVSQPPANPATDRASFYGLGWNVSYRDDGSVSLGHSGGFNLGAGTAVYLLPGSGLGITVLTNASPIGAAETVALEFLDLAQFGTIRRDYASLLTGAFNVINAPPYGTSIDYATLPTTATEALPAVAYTGSFSNDLYGALTITAEAEGLALRIGPEMRAYPLTHYDRDVFTMQPAGENAYGPSGVTFQVGPDGKADRVTIEYLDKQHQGTFVRDDAA